MIKSFIEKCNHNKDKDAFRYIKKSSLKSKTYQELLHDVYRLCNLFEESGLKKNDKIIVFVSPSYELYCLMFAGLMYGINIIVIDSFKDKKKLKYMIELSNAEYVFVNRKTKFISRILLRNIKKIDITNYKKYNAVYHNYDVDDKSIVLTTFTSGTTGIPKPIHRSFLDFRKQIEILKKNYVFNETDVIVCMLPIYVLFSLFNGNTTCIVKQLNNCNINKLKGDVLLGKIADVLKINDKITRLKEVYLGGAYIYKNECQKIMNTFIGTKINYTYGSSEGVVIGRNTLNDFYFNNRFKLVEGLNVEIKDDVNNVGEIVISGNSVITSNSKHNTGDIGYIENNYIHILGRKKYSSLNDQFYNYVKDQEIRENFNLDKAFSVWYNNKSYVFTTKVIKNSGFLKVTKIPYDLKHQTKADYTKLINKYLNKNNNNKQK